MKISKERKKALLTILVSVGLLFIVGKYANVDLSTVGLFIRNFILIVISLRIVFWFLDKKGVIDLAKETQKSEEFQRVLKSNKIARAWMTAMILGVFIIFLVPIYLFSSPKKDDPWVWTLKYDLVRSYYWAFCVVFYSFGSYVFILGRNLFKDERGKKFGNHLTSFFAFSIFTIWIVIANKQPNLVLVSAILSIGITWVQYTHIKIYKLLKESETK